MFVVTAALLVLYSPSLGDEHPRRVRSGCQRVHGDLYLPGCGGADAHHHLEAQLGAHSCQRQVGLETAGSCLLSHQNFCCLITAQRIRETKNAPMSSASNGFIGLLLIKSWLVLRFLALRISMTSENGRGTLTIRDVKEADQGAYTCEAINAKGLVFGIPDGVLTLTSNSNPGTDSDGDFRTLWRQLLTCLLSPDLGRQLSRRSLHAGRSLRLLLLRWNHQKLQKHRTLSQPR